LKAASNLFTNDVGGLLISQPRADDCWSGCPPPPEFNHEFFMVHWNSGMGKFVASRSMAYPDYQALDNFYPHPVLGQTTFAPIDIPDY
jgi:hypothetical protein